VVDVSLDILEEADNIDLISLEDAKIMLGITDASTDAQLQLLITQNSAVIAEECNRVFAREKVIEYWDWYGPDWLTFPPGITRLYLTHYPVSKIDIESVEAAGNILPVTDYYLEERSGKLIIYASYSHVAVTYTGGYVLPDEAPKALQSAIGLLVQKAKSTVGSGGGGSDPQASGIRMIAHKGARVMYYAAKDMILPGGGSTGTSTPASIDSALKSLLYNYTRHWV
jgi:Phage gp6-like head-tail connector protein